jgi:hypothetical protein
MCLPVRDKITEFQKFPKLQSLARASHDNGIVLDEMMPFRRSKQMFIVLGDNSSKLVRYRTCLALSNTILLDLGLVACGCDSMLALSFMR